MRCYFIILCMGLNACAKKNAVKPEAPPSASAKIYIEKFQSGEEPEQWEMFIKEQELPFGVDDYLKKTPEQIKNKPIL